MTAVLKTYNYEKKEWRDVESGAIPTKMNKDSVKRIIAGSGFSDERNFSGSIPLFELKIIDTQNLAKIVIWTFIGSILPLIIMVFYKPMKRKIRRKICKSTK